MTVPVQKPGKSEQVVGTPPEFLVAVRRLLDITDFNIDLAANSGNHVCAHWFGPGSLYAGLPCTDAFALDLGVWNRGGWAWLNPPFGNIKPWAARAAAEARLGAHVAMLVPASVSTEWWAEYVTGKARVLAVRPRIRFVGHDDLYPKDLALCLYDEAGGNGIQPWRWTP